jgi:hypothetical protein
VEYTISRGTRESNRRPRKKSARGPARPDADPAPCPLAQPDQTTGAPLLFSQQAVRRPPLHSPHDVSSVSDRQEGKADDAPAKRAASRSPRHGEASRQLLLHQGRHLQVRSMLPRSRSLPGQKTWNLFLILTRTYTNK